MRAAWLAPQCLDLEFMEVTGLTTRSFVVKRWPDRLKIVKREVCNLGVEQKTDTSPDGFSRISLLFCCRLHDTKLLGNGPFKFRLPPLID